MDRSRPLLYSILIHASVIGAVALLKTAPHPVPKAETRILVTLMEPQRNVMQAPQPAMVSAPRQQPLPISVPKPEAPKTVIIRPTPAHPLPAPTVESKPSPVIQNTPPPTVVSAPPKPSPVASLEPAPPPPNIQAKYEEENLARIRAILAQKRTYPKNALRLSQQGDVTLSFELTPSGEIDNLRILQSSEFELLDNAAKTLILNCASEFPKPSKTVRITVPIGYSIR